MIVLSHYQAKPMLELRHGRLHTLSTSLDLGLTQSEVRIAPIGVVFPDGQVLHWEKIEEICRSENACFLVEDSDIIKIQTFTEELQRFYSLMPTPRAPTMLLSGIPMHRIKEVDPYEDTMRKYKTISPIIGRVLDTCTGLGYTAIAAAKTAEQVVTTELDPSVLWIARRNPWSRALFDNPKITQLLGDISELMQQMESESFLRIFHDPPAFRLAGELYSGEFYQQLYRVLKPGGRVFHYIGDLESTTGRVVAKGAVKRLQEAGFTMIARKQEAFGLVAYK
jgi:predicted methyltransferase